MRAGETIRVAADVVHGRKMVIKAMWGRYAPARIGEAVGISTSRVHDIAGKMGLGPSGFPPGNATVATVPAPPQGLDPANVAWARANPSDPQAGLILLMHREGVLRVSS